MGLTPFSRFQATNGIIEKTVNFAGQNLSASGTIVLVSDLFSACLSDAVQINEVHLFAKTALNGSNGSNLDVTRRYGTDPASASDVTIFTSAGAIACDAAANVTQVFSKTSGTKLIDGAHPEDGSLSVVTLDDAFVNRRNGERFQLRLSNPGAAAITSGILIVQIQVSVGSILR